MTAGGPILALDLATVTGWATLANGVITSGSQDFTRYTGSKSRAAEHQGASFAMFRRWLHAKILEDKPELIVYEEVMRFPYAMQAHSFCAYRGLMLEAGCVAGLVCRPYGTTTVKKFWTGKGNAKKPDMMAEVMRRWPELDLTDSNEADALAILHLHLSKIENVHHLPAASANRKLPA